MKRNLINALMILAVTVIFNLPATAQLKLGGYKEAATDDARVVAAAEFAVSNRVENNTEQEGMELDSIDKAEIQSVAGMNFRLCLTVSLDGSTQQVEALVYRDLKQNYTLKSWMPKDCAPQSDGEAQNSLSGRFLTLLQENRSYEVETTGARGNAARSSQKVALLSTA